MVLLKLQTPSFLGLAHSNLFVLPPPRRDIVGPLLVFADCSTTLRHERRDEAAITGVFLAMTGTAWQGIEPFKRCCSLCKTSLISSSCSLAQKLGKLILRSQSKTPLMI